MTLGTAIALQLLICAVYLLWTAKECGYFNR